MDFSPFIYIELTQAIAGPQGQIKGDPCLFRHDQIAGIGVGWDHDGRTCTKIWLTGNSTGHLVMETHEQVIERLREAYATFRNVSTSPGAMEVFWDDMRKRAREFGSDR